MLKKILLGLVAVLVVLAGVIATRPAEFTVQRSATIQAAPEFAFAQVNDFHNWGAWSPWDKLDPDMKRTFDGASGPGAIYSWTGNDQVGEGRMTIEDSKASEFVRIKLEFIKPFPATSTTTFTFTPASEGTQVTWKMEGHNDFMGKAFSMFMNMDKMVGGDFEKGLASMKTAAELDSKKRAEAKALAEKAAAEAAAAAQAAAPATDAPPAQGTAAAPVP
ncbi:SRPBCC family protein [Hyalangium versicolor]|uniref:SRPBCC family protein n=1 Tax=Hyalangium versicolor TaxID=2861190 RepID=UPI001CCBC48C|nr:SRPBCC family protein [Hyalangium versicolor]